MPRGGGAARRDAIRGRRTLAESEMLDSLLDHRGLVLLRGETWTADRGSWAWLVAAFAKKGSWVIDEGGSGDGF